MTEALIVDRKAAEAFRSRLNEEQRGWRNGRPGSRNGRTIAAADQMVTWRWSAYWRELLQSAVTHKSNGQGNGR